MFALSLVKAYYLLTGDTELELMCTVLEAPFALFLLGLNKQQHS